MSRPQVHAGQITDPVTALALREHRRDRDALLAHLTASLQADSRVRAAWLWGSLGRGEADDLSDLDPWIIVSNDAVEEMGAGLRRHSERAGRLIHTGEAPHNGPPQGGYLGALHEGRHGLLHVDWCWQAESAMVAIPTQAILLNRLNSPFLNHDWQPVTGGQPFRPPKEWRAQVEDGINFMWLMLSISSKGLARDPHSDMSLMLYPRPAFKEAIALLGQEQSLMPLDWSVPENPPENLDRLRDLAAKAGLLTAAANTQGFAFSRLYGPCLQRYLDLVNGIVDTHTAAPS